MRRLVTIVEGLGDKVAVPKLLYRALERAGRHTEWYVDAGRTLVLGQIASFRKHFERNARLIRLQRADALLVLLDIDDGCPVTEARALAAELRGLSLPFPVAVVLARREYEAWFLASLPSLAAALDVFPNEAHFDGDPEGPRDCKVAVTALMRPGRSYEPVPYQAVFTSVFDLEQAAERSRSFQRLLHAVDELTSATAPTVTPAPSG